jgi:salicylate hydroxylase
VLAHFGFDFVRSQAVVVRKGSLLNGKTLAPIYSGSYADLKAQYGAEWYFMHRVDLHNELRRVTLQPDDCSKAAKLHLNKEVVAVDCESGMLTFADGSKVQKDLIVVADGIHVSAFSSLSSDNTDTDSCQVTFHPEGSW